MYLLTGAAMRYQFIAQHRKEYPVSRQCRVLGVSRSAYYAWAMRQRQGLSSRAQDEQKLCCWIEDVFLRHQGRYGRARLDAELREAGWIVSGKRITRLLQELGLRPRQCRPSRPKRAKGASGHPLLAGNLLNQNFAPSLVQAPNRVWCSDITYLPTHQGWLYLAVVMDLYSRRIIGWSMQDQPTQQLASDALQMAVKQRQIVSRP
jgi:transposase InsO family protein